MRYRTNYQEGQTGEMSSVLVGMFLHYLLYDSKSTKSYATMSSTNSHDIERRIAYMIKSSLKKVIDSDPDIGPAISSISMRHSSVSVNLNHFGGSIRNRSRQILQSIMKGFIKYSQKEEYFVGIDELDWPICVESNHNNLTFIMGRDLFKSDAEIFYNHNRSNDVSSLGNIEITTPLKTKVRSLHAAISNIPTIFKDVLSYRENLKTRMFNLSFETREDFRFSLFDLRLGFLESGVAAYMVRDANRNPNYIILREIFLLLKCLADARLPKDFWTDTIYGANGNFFVDITSISENGNYAFALELESRMEAIKIWLIGLCDLHSLTHMTLVRPTVIVAPPEVAPQVEIPVRNRNFEFVQVDLAVTPPEPDPIVQTVEHNFNPGEVPLGADTLAALRAAIIALNL